ncbi:MAG: alpha/beta fold hydrolase [Thiotrichales bacterium]
MQPILPALLLFMLNTASIAPAAATPASPPGRFLNVDGHQVHLLCAGRGAPAVILEAGLGGSSFDWSEVLPAVSQFTQVCAYDRAGYGYSELGHPPRTGERIAAELHELMLQAEIPAPYVLVGHSFGGYVVRLFASQHPDEIAGMVLVDASHEDQFERFEAAGLPLRRMNPTMMTSGVSLPASMPEAVRNQALPLSESANAIVTLQNETAYFQRSAQQVRTAAPGRRIPVTVLTRGRRVWPATEQGERLERTWEELQRDLFLRIGSRQVVARESGHYIQFDQPEMVVDAIANIVDQAR